MTPVDYIIAAAVGLSVLFGAVRGFLRESVALLGWLVGLWLAWRYAYLLEPYLGGALAYTELQTWAARGILLLAVVIASWILGGMLSYLVQRSGLTLGVDYVFTGTFGRTLLSAGVGSYRMELEAAQPPPDSEKAAFGWYVGVGEWFQLFRTTWLTTEIAMHRTNHEDTPVVVSAAVGLTVSF